MNNPKQEARDPNTSPDCLADLLFGFAGDVLENPALPLIVLENPYWLNQIRVEGPMKLLQRPDVPGYVVMALTQHPAALVASNAQFHIVLGEEVTDWKPALKCIAQLNCSGRHRQVLEHYNLIPHWLHPYLPSAVPVEAIEKWPPSEPVPLPRPVPLALEQLAALEFDWELRWDIAGCSMTPLETLQRLMVYPDCHMYLAMNPASSAEILTTIATLPETEIDPEWLDLDWGPHVKDHLGLNPNCPYEVGRSIKPDPRREFWFARFRTNEEMEALYREGKYWAANEAVERIDAPTWLVAEGLMRSVYLGNDYLSWFCGLLQTQDKRQLTRCITSPNWFTRFALVIREEVSQTILERLAEDANRYVRFVARTRLEDSNWSITREPGL